MVQLPHLEVGDTPTDITDGLEPGCYVAQVPGSPAELGVLYATRQTPPDADADYFHCRGNGFFAFTAGVLPTWVKSSIAGRARRVALAAT